MIKLENISGLGTMWWFELFDAEQSKKLEIKDFIEKEIFQFESDYSRFKPDSLLSRLNKNRKLENPSTELVELLNIASSFNLKTEGLFNPALGHILEHRGYGKIYIDSLNPTNESKLLIPELSKFLKIESKEVSLIDNGNLDFGGFGKGFLIDKLASLLVGEFSLQDFMINGGGDILVKSQIPKTLLLENPFEEGYSIGEIQLMSESLTGSSNQKRVWKNLESNTTYSHILNPKNLSSQSQWASFVIADNALTADVLATVVCIVGDDIKRLDNLKAQFDFEYMLISKNLTFIKSTGFPKLVD